MFKLLSVDEVNKPGNLINDEQTVEKRKAGKMKHQYLPNTFR